MGCRLNLYERNAVLLSVFERRSTAEIAARFGVTPDAIRMRLMRARRKCPALRVCHRPVGRLRPLPPHL